MNLLIVGGLLILGVLALIALIFVLRSEPDRGTSTNVIPSVPVEQEAAIVPPVADEPAAAIQFTSEVDGEAKPISEELPTNEWHPLANRQFHALVDELRSMRGQVQELERRLGTLVDEVEQGEYVHDDRQGDDRRAHTTEMRA